MKQRIKQTGLAGLLVSVLLLSGCLDFGATGPGGQSENVTKSSVGEHDVYVPKEFTQSEVTGDFSGFAIEAGDSAVTTNSTRSLTAEPQANLRANLRQTTILTTSSRDVMGFIANTKALQNEADITNLRVNYEAEIRNTSKVTVNSLTNAGFFNVDPSLFAGMNPPSSAGYGLYRLTTTQNVGVTDIAEMLAQEIGVNKLNGAVSFPKPALDEAQVSEFVIFLGLIYYSADDVVVMATVVPYDLTGTYQGLTKAATQPTNVAPAGTTAVNGSQSFTQETVANNKADFLFVVDNSGSMSDKQQAISDIADDFANAVTAANLDYRIGVITTGDDSTYTGDALRDSNSDGGFTDDINEFKSDVMVGTNGSYIESGIWFAEKALESGGTVEQDGYPRPGASLFVIMVSDEEDQYSSYSSGQAFDTADNLFIDNGYTVYSIINEGYSTNVDYENLATNTGGSYSDIKDVNSFSLIMTEIAQAAGGSASLFKLDEKAIAGSVKVTVNGQPVTENASNGFQLVNNNIVFYGSSKPEEGDSISVQYEYFQ